MSEEAAKKDYAALRKAFAEWYMNPFRGTQDAWGKENGVSPQTLSEWKADPEFVKLITDWRLRSKIAIPAMLRAVIDRVLTTGDPRAFQAVMEALGETSQQVNVNASAPFMELQKKLVELRAAAVAADLEAQQQHLN